MFISISYVCVFVQYHQMATGRTSLSTALVLTSAIHLYSNETMQTQLCCEIKTLNADSPTSVICVTVQINYLCRYL